VPVDSLPALFTLNEDTYTNTDPLDPIIIDSMKVNYNKFVLSDDPDTMGSVRSHAMYAGMI
jgi:hypothetical protein